ncbi:arylesterase [Acinetobacter baumannii]|uniref:arylesterase n=8 Tax=Gammaproteobacteria TaxID=1236 RepID=UPI001D179103|nr:arylesterase [Acinetobacter baumannii]
MYKSYLFGSKSLLLISLSMLPMFVSAKTILILGDSISAGYGIDPKQGWVQLLQKRLDQQYPKQHKVVNASVSGETTSGALARLPKLLQTYKPEVVVIELGGNDGLRGQPPQMIQKNLSQLIQLSQKQKAKVILFGMKIPPNYGTAYSKAFENSYKTVSQKYQVKLLPFFLDGVAGQKQLMQNDLIHPNTQAQSKLLNLAYPYIKVPYRHLLVSNFSRLIRSQKK